MRMRNARSARICAVENRFDKSAHKGCERSGVDTSRAMRPSSNSPMTAAKSWRSWKSKAGSMDVSMGGSTVQPRSAKAMVSSGCEVKISHMSGRDWERTCAMRFCQWLVRETTAGTRVESSGPESEGWRGDVHASLVRKSSHWRRARRIGAWQNSGFAQSQTNSLSTRG